MQGRYRCDKFEYQDDGATLWYTKWMGGPTLAKIENCRLHIAGNKPRGTVYILGEPDTYFSIPAAFMFKGCRVLGYVTTDDYQGGHAQYYFRPQAG